MRALAIAGLVVAITVLEPAIGLLCVVVFMAVMRQHIQAHLRAGAEDPAKPSKGDASSAPSSS